MSSLRPSLVPHRAFAHPLWLGALVLLVVNDHALKGSGLLPGVITGKLSDVAGLVVAPAVLAAALGIRSARGLRLAHLAVGAVFSAIKLSPWAASALEALTALTPFPWRVVVDPTDLAALPALGLSLRFLGEAAAGRERAPLALSRLLLAASSLACLASSPPNQPSPRKTQGGPQQASLIVTNQASQSAVLRVRKLRDEVQIACGVVAGSPSSMLTREVFTPAELWRIEPGEALPLAPSGRTCSAYLLDGDGLGLSIVFFDEASYPERLLWPGQGSGAEIALRPAAPGLALAEHPAVFPAPHDEAEGQDDEACQLPGPEASIDWSTPLPSGSSELVSITSSPDGCHALDLKSGRFYLCAPLPSLPCKPGDQVHVATLFKGLSGGSIDGVEVRCGEAVVRLARGGDLAPATQSDALISHRVAGCAARRAECGSVALPLELQVGESPLRSGDAVAVGDHGQLLLVRAQQMLVVDQGCFPGVTAGKNLLESVSVETPLAWLTSNR